MFFFSERLLEIVEKKRQCVCMEETIANKQSEVKYLERRQRELHMLLFQTRKEKNHLKNTINRLRKIVDGFR